MTEKFKWLNPSVTETFQGIPVFKPTNKFKLYSIVPSKKTLTKTTSVKAVRQDAPSTTKFSLTPFPVPCLSTTSRPLRPKVEILLPNLNSRQPERSPSPRPGKIKKKEPHQTRPFSFDPCDVNADKITDFRFALSSALHKSIVYYAVDKNTVKVFNAGTGASYVCVTCKSRAALKNDILWVRYHKDPCLGRNRESFKQLQLHRRQLLAEKRKAGVQSAINLPGFKILTEEEFDIEMPDYPFCRDWYYRSATLDELMQFCTKLNIPFLMTMIKPDYQHLYLCKPSLIVHITAPNPNQCSYRALSLLLSGTENNHETLKASLLLYMTTLDWNHDFVELYPNAINTAKQRYKNLDQEADMSLTPEELTALAILLHLHIFVFDTNREVNDQWQLFSFCLDKPEKMFYTVETGILLYRREGFYNAVLGLC